MTAPPDDSGEPSASVPDLTAAIARGDEEAFTRFHRLYWKRTYAYLMVVTKGNETLAADVAQATMVRAARRLGAMESEQALWAWLSRVARNAFIDTCRASDRRPVAVEWSEETLLAESHISDPFRETPLLAALDEALRTLTPDERILIEETYFHGRKQAALAVEHGLSLKALESRLTRLRQKLRKIVLSSLQNE